jgi:hypothetical protein
MLDASRSQTTTHHDSPGHLTPTWLAMIVHALHPLGFDFAALAGKASPPDRDVCDHQQFN